MNNSRRIAHISEDGRVHYLYEHLTCTAKRAEEMASVFGSGEWGRILGLWHDLGKYSDDFQRKLNGAQISVEHSGVGAALAIRMFKDPGIPLAFIIAGHHTGLANLVTSGDGLPTPLKERLKANEALLSHLLPNIPAILSYESIPELPIFLKQGKSRDQKAQGIIRRRTEFWIRFLFSVLVDADRLDTERFATPSNAVLRDIRQSSISELRERIDAFPCSPRIASNKSVTEQGSLPQKYLLPKYLL